MRNQIITSLLDTDWYKFLEMFYKFYFHRDVTEIYGSHNRTKDVKTALIIPREALEEQLSALESLTFTEAQISFFRGTGAFAKDPRGFENHQRQFKFSPFGIEEKDGQWIVKSHDLLSETFVMSIKNRLLNHFRMKHLGLHEKDVLQEAERRLREKIRILRKLPKGSVLEFGSRRRWSPEWQRRELEIVLNEVPEIVTATSNVQLALDFGIPWAGTHPHAGVLLEQLVAWIQFLTTTSGQDTQVLDQMIRASHMQFFKNWWSIFPYTSRVALTDTYGDEAFWQDWTYELAYDGRGYRWDSGDWREWTNRTVAANDALGINLTDRYAGKDATYSDGLDPWVMAEIAAETQHRFRSVLFGWGTDGSNDMGEYKKLGLTPISLVMKPIYGAVGMKRIYLVKLSNNPAKLTEAPQEFQEAVLRPFGYKVEDHTFTTTVV